MPDAINKEGRIDTADLRLAAWLYLNNAHLEAITPVDSRRCSFTFTPGNNRLGKLMEQWVNGLPVADIREAINAYLYLVHRGKDVIQQRRV